MYGAIGGLAGPAVKMNKIYKLRYKVCSTETSVALPLTLSKPAFWCQKDRGATGGRGGIPFHLFETKHDLMPKISQFQNQNLEVSGKGE